MNPQFRQLPATSIGAAMMTPLGERAGLLRGGAATGHRAAIVSECTEVHYRYSKYRSNAIAR